jgi:hypothetical protein
LREEKAELERKVGDGLGILIEYLVKIYMCVDLPEIKSKPQFPVGLDRTMLSGGDLELRYRSETRWKEEVEREESLRRRRMVVKPGLLESLAMGGGSGRRIAIVGSQSSDVGSSVSACLSRRLDPSALTLKSTRHGRRVILANISLSPSILTRVVTVTLSCLTDK